MRNRRREFVILVTATDTKSERPAGAGLSGSVWPENGRLKGQTWARGTRTFSTSFWISTGVGLVMPETT